MATITAVRLLNAGRSESTARTSHAQNKHRHGESLGTHKLYFHGLHSTLAPNLLICRVTGNVEASTKPRPSGRSPDISGRETASTSCTPRITVYAVDPSAKPAPGADAPPSRDLKNRDHTTL